MVQTLEPRPSPIDRRIGGILFAVIGALAAAWLGGRRNEAALRRRTADRLRPLTDRAAT